MKDFLLDRFYYFMFVFILCFFTVVYIVELPALENLDPRKFNTRKTLQPHNPNDLNVLPKNWVKRPYSNKSEYE